MLIAKANRLYPPASHLQEKRTIINSGNIKKLFVADGKNEKKIIMNDWKINSATNDIGNIKKIVFNLIIKVIESRRFLVFTCNKYL